jgi:hypothetical protein
MGGLCLAMVPPRLRIHLGLPSADFNMLYYCTNNLDLVCEGKNELRRVSGATWFDRDLVRVGTVKSHLSSRNEA